MKAKRTKLEVLSSLVVNPMLEKLNSKVREMEMRREIKKKAGILAQIKKVMLKMKEK